eukprot:1798087-Prorocentrum_lima.AAC.1
MAKATGTSKKDVETVTNFINRSRQQVQGEHIEPDMEMGDNTEFREIVAENQELQRQHQGVTHQVVTQEGNLARLNDVLDHELRSRRNLQQERGTY